MRVADPDIDRPRWPKYALVGLLVWIALTLALATRPLVDHVPTGIVNGKVTSEPITCHSPLSTSNAPVHPLPELEPPRVYNREACTSIHSQNRTLIKVDIAIALVGTVVLLRVIARRRGREAPVVGPSAPQPVAPR